MRRLLNLYPLDIAHSQLMRLTYPFALPEGEVKLHVKAVSGPMCFDPNTFLGRHLYFMGTYEPICLSRLRRTMKPGMVFYDIGANVGLYSILAGKLVGEGGAVHAFEPQKKLVAQLKRNIASNGLSNVNIWEAATSSEVKRDKLVQLSSTNTGQACLTHGDAEGLEQEEVSCVTLDSMVAEGKIPPCDVIKVDIEGAEHEALKGAEGILQERPPKAIFFECIDEHLGRFNSSAEELIGFLSSLGYTLEYARRGKWKAFEKERYLADGSPPDFIATMG